MTNVFYLFVCLCLMMEVVTILNMKEILREYLLSKELLKLDKEMFHKYSYNVVIGYAVLHIFYLIVSTVGIFSSQWICFSAITILSLTIGRFRYKCLAMAYVDSVLSLLLLLFALINKYHLHIDLTNLIFG